MNSKKNLIRRMIGAALAVLMVVSMFATVPFTASAEDGASANETVYLDFNAINSSVRRYGIHFDGFNYPHISASTDYCTIEFSSRAIHEAGTYTVAETGGEYLYRSYYPSTTTVYFTDGSFTITLDEGFVTLSGTFTGDDGKTYVVTVTDSDRPIETIEFNLDANNSSFIWRDTIISDSYWIYVSNDDYYIELELLNNHVEPQTPGTYTYTSENEELGYSYIGEFQSDDLPVYFVAGSYTVTVDENLVTTVCGTLIGDDGKAYVLTLTNGGEWEPTYYTLTLSLQIASFVVGTVWKPYPSSSEMVHIEQAEGTVLTLPTASEMIAEGYSFRGWFTWDQISSGQTDTGATSYTFTQDETLIAKWTPNTYTVTVDPNGGYRSIMYTSAGAVYRNTNAYTVSTVYGGWLRLFGNDGPIQRDGYRLVGFTGVNGGPTVGSFIDPAGNPSVFNDPNNYYYRIGPTDETLVAQWEKIPDEISVTIGDQIGVNLMLNLDARDAETVTVTYKDLNGDEQTETFTDFSSLPRTDEGLYKIKVQIAPAQIADTVTVYIDGETLDASVKDYCSALTDGGYGEEVAALAQAVLDYGQAANNYFNYTDEAMSTLANLTADDAKAWEKQLSDTTGKLRAMSFMALTKPEFRFYMKDITETQAAAYNAAGVTAAYTNSDITDTLRARFVKNAQGSILIEVTGVQAEYMDETIVVTVPGLGTITFAGNDFAKMMADNADLETLGAALYAYGAAAKACFA